MEIVKSLKKSSILIKGVNKVIKIYIKNKKVDGFLGISPDTLGVRLLENMLNGMKGKGMVRAG